METFPINVVLSLENGEPMAATDNPLEFWKEVAHEGQFVKDTGNARMEFAITRGMMDHWHKTFNEMRADGMEVPVPVEHTRDPEKRRGTVTELARKPNGKGVSALYAKIKFKDASAAALAKSGANVSIFVPKKIVSGVSKKEFVMPLEHLAITDYPVIHDLEPFQAVALSMSPELEGDPEVTLRELATQAGIDPSITDEQQLILALSQKLQQIAGPKPPVPGQPGAPPAPGNYPPRPPAPRPFGASKTQGEPQIQPLSGLLLSTIKNARKVQLDALATGELARITPATAKKLAERFVTDEALAFSHVDGFDDGFDTTLEALAMNPPIKRGDKTGAQAGIALSKDGTEDPTGKQGADSPLVKDMERMAKDSVGRAPGRI
jgi:hypothetical protein